MYLKGPKLVLLLENLEIFLEILISVSTLCYLKKKAKNLFVSLTINENIELKKKLKLHFFRLIQYIIKRSDEHTKISSISVQIIHDKNKNIELNNIGLSDKSGIQKMLINKDKINIDEATKDMVGPEGRLK